MGAERSRVNNPAQHRAFSHYLNASSSLYPSKKTAHSMMM